MDVFKLAMAHGCFILISQIDILYIHIYLNSGLFHLAIFKSEMGLKQNVIGHFGQLLNK